MNSFADTIKSFSPFHAASNVAKYVMFFIAFIIVLIIVMVMMGKKDKFSPTHMQHNTSLWNY